MALGGADLAHHAVGARPSASRSRGRPGSSAGAPGRSPAAGVELGARLAAVGDPAASPPRAPRSRRGGPRGGTGCSCRPRASRKVRVAHTSPASSSPLASSTVTPHSRIPSSIAQSSDDGPRSPRGPGCTIRQRWLAQIDSGISVFSIGHTISCGRCSPTAASIAAAESTTATATSWPSSVSAIHARWLRLLCADTRKRTRRAFVAPLPGLGEAELLEHQQAVEHQVQRDVLAVAGPWPPARSPGRRIGRCARHRRGARGTCPPRPRRRRSCAARAPRRERRESPPASGGGSRRTPPCPAPAPRRARSRRHRRPAPPRAHRGRGR